MARFCETRYVYAMLVYCLGFTLLLTPHRTLSDHAVVPVDSMNSNNYDDDDDDYYSYGDDNAYNATETLALKHQKMIKTWADDETTYTMTTMEQNFWNTNKKSRVSLHPTSPCVRQEYRTLTDKQRTRFHNAMQRAKTELIDQSTGSNFLDLCTQEHLSTKSPEAHDCPVFLIFHRCFLEHLEAYLRSIDPTVCLCYWASTMDSFLPDPSWSMLFSSSYMGSAYGTVMTGFAAYWGVVPPLCTTLIYPTLYRKMGSDATLLISDQMIATYMNTHTFVQTTAPTNPYWEQCHGNVHMCIGGHMSDLRCAPCDPLFYLHHCYLDYLWEVWRQKNGIGTYPDVKAKYQTADSKIMPWNTQTIISLFSQVSSSVYAPYPYNCRKNSDCKGTTLWCNKSGGKQVGRCMAGINEGGPCGTFPNDACSFPCANSVKPICNKTTKVCECVTPCASDSDCLSSQWCCISQKRCIVQMPLRSHCINETEINRACVGDCSVKSGETPPAQGYTRMAMCHNSYCQCSNVPKIML